MADIDAAFMQQILDIAKGQRETNIQHYRQKDDLTARFEVAKWIRFGHPVRLRNRPARLKLICSDSTGGADPTGWRLPAKSFETAVVKAITDHRREHAKRHTVLDNCDVTRLDATAKAVFGLADTLEADDCKRTAPLIRAIALDPNTLSIDLNPDAVADAIDLHASSLNAALCEISTPFTCKRRGVETRIVAGDRHPDPDQTLIRGLRNAHEWADALKSGEQLKHLAQRVGHSERYIRRVTSLISLSPGLQTAILGGTQPAHLNLETLVRGTIPLNWAHQDHLFGTYC